MRKRKLVLAAAFAALIVVQGVRHRWHLLGAQGIKDCRTGEVLYDGCGMLEVCAKCGFRCAEGTAPPAASATAPCD